MFSLPNRMFKKLVLPVVITIFFCTGFASAQKQADANVFGLMKIGEPFTLAECPSASYGGYKITVEKPCWKRIGASSDFRDKKKKKKDAPTTAPSPMNDTVFVTFPFDEQPALSSRSEIVVLIVDGALEGLGFNTSGIGNQEYVLAKLKEKYGEPSVYKPLTLQNRLGATFDALEAVWTFDNLIVRFSSAENSLDSGLVNIDSPKGKKHREDKINEIFKKNRAL